MRILGNEENQDTLNLLSMWHNMRMSMQILNYKGILYTCGQKFLVDHRRYYLQIIFSSIPHSLL